MRIATSYGGPTHMLLTDVVMPGVSGHDLAQQLGLQRPEMKVLCMSDFTIVTGRQEFSEAQSGLEPGTPIILKPFTRERLAQKVREVPGGMSRPGSRAEARSACSPTSGCRPLIWAGDSSVRLFSKGRVSWLFESRRIFSSCTTWSSRKAWRQNDHDPTPV